MPDFVKTPCFLDGKFGAYTPSYLFDATETPPTNLTIYCLNKRICKQMAYRYKSDYTVIYGSGPEVKYSSRPYMGYLQKKLNAANTGACSTACPNKIDFTRINTVKVEVHDNYYVTRVTGTARFDMVIVVSDVEPRAASNSSGSQSITWTGSGQLASNYKQNDPDPTSTTESCAYNSSSSGTVSASSGSPYIKTLDVSGITGKHYLYFMFHCENGRVGDSNNANFFKIKKITFE